MIYREIENLLHLRMSEDAARSFLSELTPDRMDLDTLQDFLSVMRPMALPIPDLSQPVMDCCGTGGSGLPHYNTSTTVAFVLAAGGIPVVKFGNRSMTSKSGSFDFLERLGLPVEYPLEALPAMLEQSGLAFLFAPQCYPTLGQFTQLRRSLGLKGFKTIFNFIGPLLNPVHPTYRLLGVSDPTMQTLMAEVLAQEQRAQKEQKQDLHPQTALVVRGHNGLDEFTLDGPSHYLTVSRGTITSATHTPTFAPIPPTERPPSTQTLAYTPAENVTIFNALVDGTDTQSPHYAMVCLNAGAGFVAAEKVSSIEAGTRLAQELFQSGAVQHTLQQCREAYGHV